MPTFKPSIRVKEKRLDGTINVKIRVSHNRAVRYVATDFYVLEENFDQDAGKVVLTKKKIVSDKKIPSQIDVDRINNKLTVLISTMILKCEKQRNIRFIDITSLMALLRDNRREHDMLSLIDDRIEQYKKLENFNYKESFERTRRILKDFSGSFTRFEAVDYNFLKRLEFSMRHDKLKTNTIGVHMRNIRTIFNQAITMGLVDLSLYPFRKYKIARETTRHRVLAGDQVALMYRKQFKDPLLAWARDMTMLSFFLIGINMKDLMYLKRIEDGRIHYVRSKGKRPYSIKVEPEAQEIITRYQGSKYLLNTLEKYSYYRNATKRINKKLKDLAAQCEIDKPITTYYMRHSWATIANGLRIPMDDISYGLGHQRPSLEMTEIYVEKDLASVDNANRMVIDYIVNIIIPEDKIKAEDPKRAPIKKRVKKPFNQLN